MIKFILIAVVVCLVVFVIVAALQPDEFRVERSIAVSAPPAVPFGQVNDLHRWQAVSPYTKLDPTASYVFDGAPAGEGATLSWTGNSKVGEGRMTITESRPAELIRMRMDFIKPFASTCVAEFTFHPENNGTKVTWSLAGPKNFVSKAAGLVMNMDKMIGGQFEEGLANIKRVSETASEKVVQ